MTEQLDESTAAWLREIAALGAPALHEMPVAECRAAFAQLTGQFRGEVVPVGRVADRVIAGPGGELPLRLYWPARVRPSNLPVLMYFHGGGWVIGDRDTHDHVCRRLCAAVEALVVSVEYRLAPEYKYPAAIEDCVAATRWVFEHGAELDADVGRLAVAGDSAGGHLAAVVARRLRSLIRFQLLIYPVTDLRLARYPSRESFGQGDYFLSNADMTWFGGHFLNNLEEAKQVDASPILAEDLAGLPAALTVTAGFDPLRDEGERYAALMQEAGVRSEILRYAGTIHGFVSFAGVLHAAAGAFSEMADRVRQALSE